MFSKKIYQAIESQIEERVISVQNYIERKHPVLQHYKAADSAELAKTLVNILFTLSNQQKQEIADALIATIKKSV